MISSSPSRASYFRASVVTDVAAHDGLAFVRLPSYYPDHIPVEECWRLHESALGNCYFNSLNQLTAIDTALEKSLPNMSNYFYLLL